MIFTWIVVISLEFCVGVLYYVMSEPVANILLKMQTYGAPAEKIAFISLCYHGAFIIVAVGLLIYAILRSTRVEYDTYH